MALVSSAGVFLGIMFLVAAQQYQSRIITGGILLIVGGIGLYRSASLIKRGKLNNTRTIRAELAKLASQHKGRVPSLLIERLFSQSPAFLEVIENEKKAGNLKIENDYFIFNSFLLKKLIRKCPYCGNDYDITRNKESCPSCGSDLKTVNEEIKNADDLFSLDE